MTESHAPNKEHETLHVGPLLEGQKQQSIAAKVGCGKLILLFGLFICVVSYLILSFHCL